jgi:prepilin-type N-terminal cleavage/methylation domain-containing protein
MILKNVERDKMGGRRKSQRHGFTLIELLIGSTIMLVIILAALYIYGRSNKVSVDQQQYAQVQHDVRAGMYFISRDTRMAGVNLPGEFMGYFIEGVDNDNAENAAVAPDRLRMIGNMEEPMLLKIKTYDGTANTLGLDDYSFEQYPYLDAYYANKYVLILPNPTSNCWRGQVRIIGSVNHTAVTNESLSLLGGLAPNVTLPGGPSGLGASGNCTASQYTGGSVVFADIKEYWLDVTGNYPGLTAGQNGYIGGGHGGVLYLTENGVHTPLAQNVENIQFQYRGEFTTTGIMDPFQNWNPNWTTDATNGPIMRSRIRQVRIQILGSTPNRMVSVSGVPPNNIYLYRRPALSNTPAATQNDMHKRFLLESTVNIRNMSLSIYNTGQR